MKKIVVFCLLLCLSFSLYSQNNTLNKEDIVGRWVEVRETEKPGQFAEPEYPYTYIFRDNGVFHLGESSEGVILFNITGKYTVKDDTIDVIYYDFLHSNTKNRSAKLLSLKVISLKKNTLTVLVSDYNFSFLLTLKKQDINEPKYKN